MAKRPRQPQPHRNGTAPVETTPPQVFWGPTMLEAQQAKDRRWWATLIHLLRQARDAPDAPALDDDATYRHKEVRAWHTLMNAYCDHDFDAHTLLEVAVDLLIARVQERCGAAGAPDPSVPEFGDWLRQEVWDLDIEEVDAEVENRTGYLRD